MRAYPLELDLDRRSALRIRWSDGAETHVSLLTLRQNCPCATCRAGREERARSPLRVLASVPNEADATRVQSAELAGSYALRIAWVDGHDTGIFDFALLRALSESVAAQPRAEIRRTDGR